MHRPCSYNVRAKHVDLSHPHAHIQLNNSPLNPFRLTHFFSPSIWLCIHSTPRPQTNSQRIELSATTTQTRIILYYTETTQQKNATNSLPTRHSQEDSKSAFKPTDEQECRYSCTFLYFHSLSFSLPCVSFSLALKYWKMKHQIVKWFVLTKHWCRFI